MLDFVLGYSAGQRSASRAASLARSAAASDVSIHSNRVEDLSERVDQLSMILKALWALLEEDGYKPEDLVAKLEELDLADGELDGQIRQHAIDCPSCESKVAPGLPNCQFCGAAIRSEESNPLGHI